MIYLILTLSLAGNGVLIWYIRKLLQKYWFDVEARERFTEMLQQYADSLESFYKLEELYGEEIIKKGIVQTQFVIEACKEFKEAIDTQITRQEDEAIEAEIISDEERSQKDEVIRLREGEKVSQSAANYRRVVADR